MPQPAHEATLDTPVSLLSIFAGLLAVALCGVGGGGGLVWARRISVERRRWISERDFADIVSLCQFMPGPNIVGIAVCIGTRLRGGAGALAALAGFLVIPWTVGFVVAVLLLQHSDLPIMRRIMGGLSAAAAGLLIATGIRILLPHRSQPAAVVFAALALGLVVFGKLPLLLVLFALVPISIAVAYIESASAP
jgi:chromate transporter